MMKLKKSKKGITLVESVIAVVVLSILAIGVLTMLTVGGVKIQEISGEAAAYAEATQKLDLAISAISNGACVEKDSDTDFVSLKDGELKTYLGLGAGDTLTGTRELYQSGDDPTSANVRGWYLELTYKGVTVKGFASNSEGVFDS